MFILNVMIGLKDVKHNGKQYMEQIYGTKKHFFCSHSVKTTHNTTLVVYHLMCITISFTLLFLCFLVFLCI